jgi:hypothetical protein
MVPDVQHYASQNREPPSSSQIHGTIPLMSDDDESDWLHRNDAYNMHAKQGGTGPNLNAHNNFGGACSLARLPGNIILCIMFYLFQ